MSGDIGKNDDGKKMLKVYHYTSKEGAEAIRKSQKIIASVRSDAKDDAIYGSGVYLTTKSPSEYTQEEIETNNYDNATQQNQGKVEYVVSFEIPIDKIKQHPDKRNIFSHKDDVDLTKYKYTIKKADFKTK